jgi:hypothetical protein
MDPKPKQSAPAQQRISPAIPSECILRTIPSFLCRSMSIRGIISVPDATARGRSVELF